MRLARAIPPALVALCGGALAALALAPFGLWPLEFVGLCLFHLGLTRRRNGARALIGFAFGLGYLLIGFAFVAHFTALGYVALVVFEALFFAGSGLAAGPGGRPGAFAGSLVLVEWLRGVWPFDGVPVATLALGQVDSPFACLARLGGPLLVTFGTAAVAASLGSAAATALRAHPRVPARGTRYALGVRVVGTVVVCGVFAATIASRGGAAVGSVRAAAVQGGGRRGLTSLQSNEADALRATLAETRKVPAGVSLIVWPEDVVALAGPLRDSAARAVLSRTARARRATLLVGVTVDAPRERFYNEIVAFGPSGREIARFEKVRDVPFGEFVPFRTLLSHVANFSAVPRDAIPGHASGAITTPAGRLGLLVSYETFFAARGRSDVRAGATALVTETNTASYATSQVPATELDASRLQAIAEGRDLLQAATTGYSALVTPTGSVRDPTALGDAGLAFVRLPLRSGATIYARLGDTPLLTVAVLLCLFGLRRRVRRGADEAPRRGKSPRGRGES